MTGALTADVVLV